MHAFAPAGQLLLPAGGVRSGKDLIAVHGEPCTADREVPSPACVPSRCRNGTAALPVRTRGGYMSIQANRSITACM